MELEVPLQAGVKTLLLWGATSLTQKGLHPADMQAYVKKELTPLLDEICGKYGCSSSSSMADRLKTTDEAAIEPASSSTVWWKSDNAAVVKAVQARRPANATAALKAPPLPFHVITLPLPMRIVVADGATETELWAAAKLSEILALPTTLGAPGGTAAAQIAIGYGAAVALGVRAPALNKLDDDSFLVSTKASRGVPARSIAIASSAHSARGTMNAIYGFLRAVNYEFFAENVTCIPPTPIALPIIDLLYSPSYTYRDLGMASGIQPGIGCELDRKHIRMGNCSAVAKASNWTGGICQGRTIWRPGTNLGAALGLNGWFSLAPVGGTAAPHNPPGFVATAYNLLTPGFDSDAADCDGPGTNEPHPPNTICPAVFRRHPHWFTCGQPAGACTATTVNQTFSSQPCWLAPGVVETMTKSILTILHADPTAKLISVSNMDGGVSRSPCPLDMVAATAENATGGGNFYAVRQIAAAVAKDFPHVKIEVLAYNGAQQPPKKLKFADNVIVRIAGFSAGAVSLHHLKNAFNLAVVKGWVRAAKTVYIWNGVNNGEILPHGDCIAQALHIKELAELGVTGYFAEGNGVPGSDFADLRVFLAGRMAFDTTLDIEKLLAEFLDNYYGGGEVAKKVGKYIKLISAAFATANHSIDFTGKVMEPLEARYLGSGPNSSVFGNETLLAGAALLTAARTAAVEPTYQHRVDLDLMHLQYVILVRWDSLRLNATAMHVPWPLHDSKEAEFKLFAAAYNTSGIRSFSEYRKYPPRCGGLSPCWTRRSMTLATFHTELFGQLETVSTGNGAAAAEHVQKDGESGVAQN